MHTTGILKNGARKNNIKQGQLQELQDSNSNIKIASK